MRRTLLLLALLSPACTTTDASDVVFPVVMQISGTAYRFNSSDPIVGAKIQFVELSQVTTTTDAHGEYSISLLAGKTVTPYITADTYHSIHLQTFTAETGKDLAHVFFQTPDDGIFGLLAQLVGVDPKGPGCHIVSTVSTKAIQGLSFAEFTKFGAHGVAGATADSVPPLAKPLYFNEQVIPDAKRTETSNDGGVMWLNVPPGTYTFTAHHPTRKFATFTATCVPGRIINANPPWGLHEL